MNTEGILQHLRQIIDPELGCNIVDLGLIYDLQVAGGIVYIKMTLTSPGCPMQDAITQGIEALLTRLPGIEDVQIELVWSPPWNPHMMSREGARILSHHEI